MSQRYPSRLFYQFAFEIGYLRNGQIHSYLTSNEDSIDLKLSETQMHLKKGRIEGVEEYGARCEADALVCHFELRYQFNREQANAMLRRMDLR